MSWVNSSSSTAWTWHSRAQSLCRQATPGSCGYGAPLRLQHRDAAHVMWLHCNLCMDTHVHWRGVLPGLGPVLKAQQGAGQSLFVREFLVYHRRTHETHLSKQSIADPAP